MIAAVAGQNFRLRQVGGRSVFVRVAEDELAWLERRAGAGRRYVAGAFDDRLREPVAIAEVVVRVIERRRRLQVQRREHLNAFALRDEFCVLRPDSARARLRRGRTGSAMAWRSGLASPPTQLSG